MRQATKTRTMCPKCGKTRAREGGQMCGACHVAYGGKLCVCGALIDRADRMCRVCWTSMGQNLHAQGLREGGVKSNARRQSDVALTNLSEYRMETTQVGMVSAESDDEFYRSLLSDQAREGLEKWKANGGNTE